MRFSTFSSKFATEPETHEMPWSALRDGLLDDGHIYDVARKDDVPMLCPAVFDPPKRKKRNVVEVSMAVLDCDDLTDPEVERLVELLDPYEGLLYTSWSHADAQARGRNRLRALLPLSAPVAAVDWPAFWARLHAMVGGLADAACKDASRLYAGPYAPPGTEADNRMLHLPGAVLDPRAVLAAPADAYLPQTTRPLARDQVEHLAKKLRRRSRVQTAVLGDALVQVCRGEAYAEEGTRDTTTYKLCGELLKEWPDADPKSAAELFAPSLDLMERLAPGAPTPTDVESKMRRRREEIAEQRQIEIDKEHKSNTARIKIAFRGERATSYSQDELEAFADAFGVDTETFLQTLILHKGPSHWLFVDGTYRGPWSKDDVNAAADFLLRPAMSWGVQTTKVTDDGALVRKSRDTLVQQYGMPLESVRESLVAQTTYLDFNHMELTNASAPRRPLGPQYDTQVDEWLRLLGGERAETLMDWLAYVTYLDEPCAALYLSGAKGTGKTLLAQGLARIWTDQQATPLERVAGNFNSPLSDCPLVFADESMPDEFSGRRGTGKLREFIAQRTRTLSRKFQDDRPLIGAVRLIIAGNNAGLISTNEELTEHDIDAIVDRLLHIEVGHEAAEYLAALADRGKSFRFRDRIARHALWLVENRAVKPQGRFLVSGSFGKLHRQMTTSHGTRSDVCAWLVGFLLEPQTAAQKPAVSDHLMIAEGRLLVKSRALVNGWELYKTNARYTPRIRTMGQALAALSEGRKEWKGQKFYAIKTENLVDWAEEADYATADEIEDALARGWSRRDAAGLVKRSN